MRCSNCNKFVSFDSDVEPEVDLEVDVDGHVSGSVRIVNSCGDCGDGLTETTFDVDVDLSEECEGHLGEKHTLEVEVSNAERTERSGYFDRKKKTWVNSYGRYAKHFYGASVDFVVTCACGKLGEKGLGIHENFKDDCQASSMDSLQ